jgi:xylan 1,4-beta-xylosidase
MVKKGILCSAVCLLWAGALTGQELLTNGNFSAGTASWSFASYEGAAGSNAVTDGAMRVTITAPGSEVWHIQLIQAGLSLQASHRYTVSFSASAAANRTMTVGVEKNSTPYNDYAGIGSVSLTTQTEPYTKSFRIGGAEPNARISFNLGKSSAAVTLDNVSITDEGVDTSSLTVGATYRATVDAGDDLGELDHFWSRAAGNGNARLQAQSDMRTHLKWCHDEWGMGMTIHHGLLNDSMHIYREDAQGNPQYEWKMFDSCYDYTIKELGMAAHFTLFPMPHDLAASLTKIGHVFNGAPCYLSMPKDLNKWKNLCQAIARHVVDRYGIDVARRCYFRVWNENDIDGFALGTMDDWQHVYDYAVEGVRSVDAQLKVGGPSLSSAKADILGTFLDHCLTDNYADPQKSSTPVDFISFHAYGSNANEAGLFGEAAMVNGLRTVQQVLASRNLLGKVGIHITEYGASWARNYDNPISSGMDEPYGKHDSQTAAAFIVCQAANALYDWAGAGIGINNPEARPTVMSYWTISDVFDEDGPIDKDFINCHGLITRHSSIRKPSFNAFKMLHMLGDRLLPLEHTAPGDTVKGLAAKRSTDGQVQVLLYNCPRADVTQFIDHPVNLTVNGIASPSGKVTYELYQIDRTHSNSFKVWDRLGRPEPMSAAQVDSCKAHQQLEKIRTVAEYTLTNGSLQDSIYLPGQSVALAVITPLSGVGTVPRSMGVAARRSASTCFSATVVQGILRLPADVRATAKAAKVYDLTGRLLCRVPVAGAAPIRLSSPHATARGIVLVKLEMR